MITERYLDDTVRTAEVKKERCMKQGVVSGSKDICEKHEEVYSAHTIILAEVLAYSWKTAIFEIFLC